MPDRKEVEIPAEGDELLPSIPKILLVDDNDSAVVSYIWESKVDVLPLEA